MLPPAAVVAIWPAVVSAVSMVAVVTPVMIPIVVPIPIIIPVPAVGFGLRSAHAEEHDGNRAYREQG